MNHFLSSPAEADLQELINSRREGHALPRAFYTSTALYQHELERVWGEQWISVGHRNQIKKPGDYFLFEFGCESVIVVRDNDDSIKAHLNVCRHRGSRVCLQSSGHTRSFTCPYHAWTYGIDGALRSGRYMPEGFDVAQHNLRPVQILDFQGLLFICLSDNPPELPDAINRMVPLTNPFELEKMKVAADASYPVPANWKLALENYLECYHCAPSHTDYSKSHSLKDPDSMTTELVESMEKKSIAAGLPTGEHYWPADESAGLGTDLYYRRYPLYTGYETGSRDGKPVAPLLGKLSSFDGGATDISIGPLNHFLIYSDHLVSYRFIPRSLQTTDIQVVWMVHEDAVEDKDYSLNNLTWLWDVTSKDDERIIRHNQAGVNSQHYEAGPLSTMEWGIDDFYKNYFRMIS